MLFPFTRCNRSVSGYKITNSLYVQSKLSWCVIKTLFPYDFNHKICKESLQGIITVTKRSHRSLMGQLKLLINTYYWTIFVHHTAISVHFLCPVLWKMFEHAVTEFENAISIYKPYSYSLWFTMCIQLEDQPYFFSLGSGVIPKIILIVPGPPPCLA